MPNKEPSSRVLNIVFLGSFNPAILSPTWLEAKGIINETEASASKPKIGLIHNDVSKFEVSDCLYEIFLNRFSITTKHTHLFEKAQDITIKIFDLLKETPITKVGINWHHTYDFLESEHEDYINFGHKHIPKKDFWDKHLKNPGLYDLRIQSEREDNYIGQYNIYIKKSNGRSVELHFNDHYDLQTGEDTTISNAEKAIEIINTDFSKSRSKANKILKELFEYGTI